MRDRYGEGELATRFRAFDTICSATQERQDAVVSLLDAQPIDLAVVIGGYNSSNTCNLARICAERVPTFHIAEPDCLVSADEIRHRPIGAPSTASVPEQITTDWLPAGPVAHRPDGRRFNAQQRRRAGHPAPRVVRQEHLKPGRKARNAGPGPKSFRGELQREKTVTGAVVARALCRSRR